MKSKLVMGAFVLVPLVYLSALYILLWNATAPTDISTADLFAKCGFIVAATATVGVALYGERVRLKIDPVQVLIEVTEKDGNNDFDDNHDGRKVYHHHLRVVNRTPHQPLRNARVWLKSISQKSLNGEWDDAKMRFAVPRLMEWAPSEWDKEGRTFCTRQILDLGKTHAIDGHFFLTINGKQGAAIKKLPRFESGTTYKCVFYVTADNYQQEEEFSFMISVPTFVSANPSTPADVRLIVSTQK